MGHAATEHGAGATDAGMPAAGVATFPHDGTTAEALVSAAETALQQAKDLGRNRVVGSQAALATLIAADDVQPAPAA